MTQRQPDLDKRVIRLPDGRRLVFYRFPEEARPEGPPAGPGTAVAPPAADSPPLPPGEER